MIKKTLSGLSLIQVLILYLLKLKEKTHVVLFSKQERVRSFFRLFFFYVKMCLWIDIIIATLLMTYLPTRYSVLNFFMFRLLRVPQRSCIVFIK